MGKKSKMLTNKQADKTVILLYFIAAFISLNRLDPTLSLHALGIAFIVAGTYGIVVVSKNKTFLFQ